mmetsp:Transcript_71994/g.204303  ORF Transcript_71994/g.204303 Transcript_71994/m.204303 type:complete len:731 (+) Transcript_71994:176-2368(+)
MSLPEVLRGVLREIGLHLLRVLRLRAHDDVAPGPQQPVPFHHHVPHDLRHVDVRDLALALMQDRDDALEEDQLLGPRVPGVDARAPVVVDGARDLCLQRAPWRPDVRYVKGLGCPVPHRARVGLQLDRDHHVKGVGVHDAHCLHHGRQLQDADPPHAHQHVVPHPRPGEVYDFLGLDFLDLREARVRRAPVDLVLRAQLHGACRVIPALGPPHLLVHRHGPQAAFIELLRLPAAEVLHAPRRRGRLAEEGRHGLAVQVPAVAVDRADALHAVRGEVAAVSELRRRGVAVDHEEGPGPQEPLHLGDVLGVGDVAAAAVDDVGPALHAWEPPILLPLVHVDRNAALGSNPGGVHRVPSRHAHDVHARVREHRAQRADAAVGVHEVGFRDVDLVLDEQPQDAEGLQVGVAALGAVGDHERAVEGVEVDPVLLLLAAVHELLHLRQVPDGDLYGVLHLDALLLRPRRPARDLGIGLLLAPGKGRVVGVRALGRRLHVLAQRYLLRVGLSVEVVLGPLVVLLPEAPGNPRGGGVHGGGGRLLPRTNLGDTLPASDAPHQGRVVEVAAVPAASRVPDGVVAIVYFDCVEEAAPLDGLVPVVGKSEAGAASHLMEALPDAVVDAGGQGHGADRRRGRVVAAFGPALPVEVDLLHGKVGALFPRPVPVGPLLVPAPRTAPLLGHGLMVRVALVGELPRPQVLRDPLQDALVDVLERAVQVPRLRELLHDRQRRLFRLV